MTIGPILVEERRANETSVTICRGNESRVALVANEHQNEGYVRETRTLPLR